MASENHTPTAGTFPPRTPARRRTVLKAAGLATLAATAVGTAARSAHATDDTARPPEPYDVIVVGAGFAGVAAARAVRAQGLRTLLLEARDRVGGRTWTDTFAGERVEMGGAWVHPIHTRVWHEIQSHGISLVADDTPPDRLILPSGSGYAPFSPTEAGTRLGELLTDFFAGSEAYFPHPHDPLHRIDLLAEPDRLTLRDRLDQLRLSPQDDAWLNGHTAALPHAGEDGTGQPQPAPALTDRPGHPQQGRARGVDRVPAGPVEDGPDGTRTLPVPPDDQVANSVAAFVTAVRDDTPPDPVVLEQATLLDELRAAATTP